MCARFRSLVSWFLILSLILTMGFLVVLLTPWEAQAQTHITVTDGGDIPVPPPDYTLRDAINAANIFTPGTEVIINFDPSVSTVNLTSQLPPLTRDNSPFGPNITIDGEYDTDQRVLITSVFTPGANGLVINNGWEHTIRNARFTAFDGDGIQINNCGNHTIDNVRVSSVNSHAIVMNYSPDNEVINDTEISGTGGYGIHVHNSNYNLIDTANINWCQLSGIYIQNDDGGTDSNQNEILNCDISDCATNAAGPFPGDSTDEYGIKVLVTAGESIENQMDFDFVYDCGNDGTGWGGGIGLFNSDDNEIRGCLIGTSNGFSADGNEADGLVIRSGSSSNIIGADALRNTILDNGRHGIYVADGDTDGNEIRQNNVGINLINLGTVGNQGWGIKLEGNAVDDPINTQIGESNPLTPLTPGRVGGNEMGGIYLYDIDDTGDPGTTIQSNAIGTGFVAPFIELGNNGDGILIEDCTEIIIGADDIESDPYEYNVIGDNDNGSGIRVLGDAPQNGIYVNEIFGNDFLGIDLDPVGPDIVNTPQTSYPYPTVGQPNEWMNFPVITDASRRPDGQAQAGGTAEPNSKVFLYYADDDDSGYGQGETYIGETDADGGGNWTYDGSQIDPDEILTATAMDGTGNSSEFAYNVMIEDAIPPEGTIDITGGAAVTSSRNVDLDLTATDDYYAPTALEYQLSNYSDFHDASWEAVPLTGIWPIEDWQLLAGDGKKTVYYRLKNTWQTSGSIKDSITLKQSKPTGSVLINNGATTTSSRAVALTLDVNDWYYKDSQMEMQVSNNSNFDGATWEPFKSTRNWTLTAGAGEKSVYVRYRDPLGNTGGKYADKITLESGEPVAGPTWYLAEGTTAWGFSTYITIQNPNDSDMVCTVTYMPTDGGNIEEIVGLPASSQTTLTNDHLREVLGEKDFSTKVQSMDDKTIAVDRTMYWTGEGAPSPDGHCSVGVTSADTTWYLPEGSTNWGFETWLLIQNPNTTEATAQVTYMIEGADPVTVQKNIPANARKTYNMANDIGAKDASIKVVSDIPVIPERAMYRNNRRSGHDSIGTTAPAADYYLAEGTTGWGFTTYVLVQNPNDSATDVNVTYLTTSGDVQHPENPINMPANSRDTIRVNDFLPGTDFSTKVSGSNPIIAERAMYWGAGTELGEAAHDSIGMDAPHTTFYLPDGQTSEGHETYTLVANPNNTPVTVEITYLTPDGKGNVTFEETVGANSRMTYSMVDKGINGRAAVLVTSKTAGAKIMVERAMYWNNRGAGTDTIGGYGD